MRSRGAPPTGAGVRTDKRQARGRPWTTARTTPRKAAAGGRSPWPCSGTRSAPTRPTATITVRWSVQDDYNVHYSDVADRDLRWDVHPHDYTDPDGDAHYHPPPHGSSDDDDVEASCISVAELVLVARAVHQLWRAGYDRGTVDPLNDAVNPP